MSILQTAAQEKIMHEIFLNVVRSLETETNYAEYIFKSMVICIVWIQSVSFTTVMQDTTDCCISL